MTEAVPESTKPDPSTVSPGAVAALSDWSSCDPLMVMTGICVALNAEATPDTVAYIATMKSLLAAHMRPHA